MSTCGRIYVHSKECIVIKSERKNKGHLYIVINENAKCHPGSLRLVKDKPL